MSVYTRPGLRPVHCLRWFEPAPTHLCFSLLQDGAALGGSSICRLRACSRPGVRRGFSSEVVRSLAYSFVL